MYEMLNRWGQHTGNNTRFCLEMNLEIYVPEQTAENEPNCNHKQLKYVHHPDPTSNKCPPAKIDLSALTQHLTSPKQDMPETDAMVTVDQMECHGAVVSPTNTPK